MPRQIPRVLIISDEIPQSRNAGSILLSRLFAGYGESEKLKCGKAEPEPKEETGLSQTLKNKPGGKLFVIGPRPHPEAELLDCPYRELRMPLRRLETSRFNVHKRSLQAFGLIPLPSHRKILRMLGDFRPDVVVTVMQNTSFICVAERTARKLGMPLVLIVHDLNEEFEKVFSWAKRALLEKNRAVYRAASRRLCVSPEMAAYLAERYGVPGEVMYPNRSEELQPRTAELSLTLRAAADQETKRRKDEKGEGDKRQAAGSSALTTDSPPATSNSLQASATLTLGYAGSLAYGYGEALVDLIPVLREVGARILISTPRPPENLKALLEANDVVEWMPHRADINEMWRQMQARADVLILPYSNPAGPHDLLYRTHFPSKLTEYLALGMPVIVSGPEFATGLRWAQAEKLKNGKSENLTTGAEGRAGEPAEGSPKGDTSGAREATSNKLNHQTFQRFSLSEFLDFAPNGAVPCTTRDELVACLSRLKQDGELRLELARWAVEAGKRDFDPARIRETFWETLEPNAV